MFSNILARNTLLHQLQKFLCVIAEEFAHYKNIWKPAEMKNKIEKKNIDSFMMSVCKTMLRTYPESSMWYRPCDLWEVMTELKEFLLGWWDWAKTQKNLSYVREIENIWLIDPRTENNKKWPNTSV